MERATGEYQTFTLNHGGSKRFTKYIVPVNGFETYTCATMVEVVSGKINENEVFSININNKNTNYYHASSIGVGWGGYIPKLVGTIEPVFIEVTNYSSGPVTYRVYWNYQYLNSETKRTVWDGYVPASRLYE